MKELKSFEPFVSLEDAKDLKRKRAWIPAQHSLLRTSSVLTAYSHDDDPLNICK